jgi:hypothetical protein
VFVITEIFHDSHERRLPNYPDISGDEPYLGTSFGQGGGGFNQFGSMESYLDPTSSEIRVCQYWMVRSRYPRVEDTNHKRGDMLVHPDPLMLQSALGFRGSCREGGARCASQMVNYIRRICHPLQRSEVVAPARPMNCLWMLGLVILPLMRLAMLMHQLLLSVNRMKKIVRSQNVVI